MRILITGASGFIGSHLAKHLHTQGHTIMAGTRNPQRWQAMLPMYTWSAVDFRHDLQADIWLPRLTQVDLVINTVGIIAERGGQNFREIQTLAPQALFTPAHGAESRSSRSRRWVPMIPRLARAFCIASAWRMSGCGIRAARA